VTAGLASPFIEQILHHGFASGLGAELAAGSVAPSMDGSSFHGVVPALALLFLVAGAWPAYYLYVSRKASSQAFLNNHTLLQALYRFFWNRWSIEGIYHRVFVDGTTRLAAFLSDDVEERWDNLVHRRLPVLFTEKTQRLVHRLRTETEELVYNVSYVLVLFVVLLTFLLLGRSGN